MESKNPIQTPKHQITKAHLYVRFADVACGLRPPCCTSCPRLPQVATANCQFKHQTKPPELANPRYRSRSTITDKVTPC